jgi:hypothetical protein
MSHLQRSAVLLPVLCIAALAAACETERSCTLIACANAIKVDVRDGGGTAQTSFQGVVNIQGAGLALTCPATQPGDQTAEVLGHTVWASCAGDGGFYLGDLADRGYALSADLTGPAGAFVGALDISTTTVEDFNGKGCGSCSSGSTSVVLQ